MTLDVPPRRGRVDLPMYDWPELSEATDRFWSAVAAELGAMGVSAPATIARDPDLWSTWRSPELLLSQVCGAPMIRQLQGAVSYVGTPDYAVAGWEDGRYSSVIVTRKGGRHTALSDLPGAVAAVNDLDSISGFWSLASLGLEPARLHLSGAHRRSARMVAEGQADFAAIDTYCWDLLSRFEPAVHGGLSPVGRTRRVPAPPFITAVSTPRATIDSLFAALSAAAREPEVRDALADLRLTGFRRLGVATYRAELTPLLESALAAMEAD